MDKLIKFFATGFGLGFSPVAPATVGSLLGLGIVIPMAAMGYPLQIVISLVLILVAVPLCAAAETAFARKDDGRIVADEFLMFPICLIGIPFMTWPAFLVIAFIVARIMDLLKPPPARAAQALAGGIGIVMDDVLANVYALVINHLIWRYAIERFVLAG